MSLVSAISQNGLLTRLLSSFQIPSDQRNVEGLSDQPSDNVLPSASTTSISTSAPDTSATPLESGSKVIFNTSTVESGRDTFELYALTSSLIEGIFANPSSPLTGDEQYVQKAIKDSMRLYTLAVDNRWISPYAILHEYNISRPLSSKRWSRQGGGSAEESHVPFSDMENGRRKSGSPNKNPKRHRAGKDVEQIIQKYIAEHPLTVGDSLKSMAKATVLAKYGRNEISLDGQFAESKELKEIEKCKRCQQRQLVCIKVTVDDFWHRHQCTECVQHHSNCTLAPKRDKIRKKRRYVTLLVFIHFIELSMRDSKHFLCMSETTSYPMLLLKLTYFSLPSPTKPVSSPSQRPEAFVPVNEVIHE